LWRDVGEYASIVGIGDGVKSAVTSPQVGILESVLVKPYEIVRRGQPLARLRPSDPMAEIDLVQTQLEIARIRLMPSLAEENAMDYERLRTELLRTQSDVALAEVSLARAESDVRRNEKLFAGKLISEDAFELSVTARDLLKTEVHEKRTLLAELRNRFEKLSSFGNPDASTNDMRTALARGLEHAFEVARTNWQPLVIVAPIDGMVQAIARQSGEHVEEGELLFILNSLRSERVIGYLRQPYSNKPEVGAKVLVSTRSQPRREFESQIEQVGAHFEVITNAAAFVRQGSLVDTALPLVIGVPEDFQLSPGELVDLQLGRMEGSGVLPAIAEE
jgi:multidrug resistance efflux pump